MRSMWRWKRKRDVERRLNEDVDTHFEAELSNLLRLLLYSRKHTMKFGMYAIRGHSACCYILLAVHHTMPPTSIIQTHYFPSTSDPAP